MASEMPMRKHLELEKTFDTVNLFVFLLKLCELDLIELFSTFCFVFDLQTADSKVLSEGKSYFEQSTSVGLKGQFLKGFFFPFIKRNYQKFLTQGQLSIRILHKNHQQWTITCI